MRPLYCLTDFQLALNSGWDLFHVVGGRTELLDYVSAVNLRVLDVLVKIKDGTIFCRE